MYLSIFSLCSLRNTLYFSVFNKDLPQRTAGERNTEDTKKDNITKVNDIDC